MLGEVRRGIESIRRRDAISATALEHWLVHDLVLVTRNVGDVSGTGVRVLDPTA